MKFNSQNGYKASIYKNGVPMNSKKDFFPDEWNEEKVIDAIKEALVLMSQSKQHFHNEKIPILYSTV